MLYRLPAVIEAVALGRQIFIVEGEKDAENVAGLGLTATTNCGGAGRWRPEYSDALRHAVVTILPDNDETGQRHALAVATALIGVAREIRIVQLPGLPEKGDVSDWIAAGGRREELEVLVANAALFELQPSLFSSPTPPRRYQFHTMDELATFPPTEWLVEELLVCESLAIMYAPPASYKSFLALDIALCVAAGIPWNGRAVRQGAAVYVAAEGNVGQMAKRVSAWCTHHGVDPSSLPFTVVPSMVELGSEHAIADFIRELPSRSAIVVIDTLARCAPGLDENRSADMGRVIQAADRIREAAGGLVLLVHHARKNDSQIRGSSALEAAADTTIALRRSNNAAVVTVSCTKQKDAAEFEDFMLQITDVASSAVLIPAGKPQKRSTLSTNDHKALLALAPEGASSAAWLAACHLRPSSYHESKKRLLRNQLVRQDGKLFRSTASSDTGDSFGELSEAAA
ncbi:MAG: AAA family ATPase [Gemmatimonadota bacterium]